ncbi:MAG: dihydroxyacetone kinase subunit DhaK [Aestuariivirga sp.]
MTQFINSKENLVTESLDGFLRVSGNARLARLDGFPHIKVIYRTDHKPSRVALISGGGSGHEPAHAGFVGKGMLTAAVCGEVFASPSVEAVLAGILAVTGKGGCLLIVKNYTGDRLNFGLAAEKARALGRKVEMVVVADDVAIPGITQPRGVAGTLFVHKIAGCLAEQGASLPIVAEAARKVASSTMSLGISLSSCTIPGVGREDRVPHGKAELGLGIHGEPGVDLIDFAGARQAADILTEKLFAGIGKAASYALLLNNLGSTTPLELGVIANEILASPQGRKIKLVVGPSPLMTSLDMHGISATLLPLSPRFEKALAAPAAPAAWPGAQRTAKPAVHKLPKEIKPKPVKPSSNPALRGLVESACDVLIASEAALNALDAKVGDGDTGSTIAGAARNLKSGLGGMPLANTGEFFASLSGTLSKTMGGSSGVLFAILFAAAGSASAKGSNWPQALQSGLRRMMEYGGAKAGDRTMIDALEPALAALVSGASVAEAASAARKGANATAMMVKARAGRSTYVSATNLKGIVDPGAEAVACLLEGLVRK